MLTRILAGALGLVVLLAAWQWHAATSAQEEADKQKNRAETAERMLKDERTARGEEKRRADALQEAQNANHQARLVAEADARAAQSAAGRLRQRAAALAASCSARNPEAAASSPAASAPGDLLADMLGRIDEAAGELARYADDARIAGQLCERSYRALSPPP